jgi:hypothetical protein
VKRKGKKEGGKEDLIAILREVMGVCVCNDERERGFDRDKGETAGGKGTGSPGG